MYLNIWFSIFIPLIGVIIAAKFFNQYFVWWEYFIGTVTSIIVTGLFLLVVLYNINSDIEYHGSIITSAKYTEYYETWLDRTCSKQVACGEDCSTDSKGNKTCTTRYCTEYYDCSYCDENNAHWTLYDNIGNNFSTSQEHYTYLKELWNNENFIELNRNIDYSHGCGKDGNAYVTYFDKNIFHSENKTISYNYENPTLTANSAFKYKDWDIKEVREKGLYDYPVINEDQNNILGYKTNDSINILFKYLNGYVGSMYHARFYFLFFSKDQSIALDQENYWKNGNQNEIIICIGHNNSKLTWVKVFGWNNDLLKVKLKDEILSTKYVDFIKIYNICIENIKYYKINNLQKEFEFLKPDLPNWCFITIYILNVIITILALIFGIKNEI